MSDSKNMSREELAILKICSNDYEPFSVILEEYQSEFESSDEGIVKGLLVSLISKGYIHHFRVEDGKDGRLEKARPENLGFRGFKDMFFISASGLQLIQGE